MSQTAICEKNMHTTLLPEPTGQGYLKTATIRLSTMSTRIRTHTRISYSRVLMLTHASTNVNTRE